jgi:hypothetical protein
MDLHCTVLARVFWPFALPSELLARAFWPSAEAGAPPFECWQLWYFFFFCSCMEKCSFAWICIVLCSRACFGRSLCPLSCSHERFGRPRQKFGSFFFDFSHSARSFCSAGCPTTPYYCFKKKNYPLLFNRRLETPGRRVQTCGRAARVA